MAAIKRQKKELSGESSTEIIPQDNQIVNFNAETLISQAITQKLPVDTMERLLAMRKELKAEWAKEQYDSAMAQFQQDCPTIQKQKKVSFGTTNYSYAPLEVIVEQVKGLLSANGFSYTFDTEETEKGIAIFCFVKHTNGHMEKSKCFIAIDTGSKMNISQKSGAAMTYGKRYAFVNAFGILTGDEDTDARPQEEPTYNYEAQLQKPFDDSEVLKMILADLAACDTAEEYALRSSDIKIARENGKLSDESYKIVVEACKEKVKRIQNKDLKPIAKELTPGEKMIAKGKELKAGKVLSPSEIVESYGHTEDPGLYGEANK